MYKKLNYLGITIDDYSKKCIIDGEEVKLQRLLYKLLYYFIKNKKKVITHKELRDNVWRKNVTPRCIFVSISKLKRYIKPYDKNIRTYCGFGYKFE